MYQKCHVNNTKKYQKYGDSLHSFSFHCQIFSWRTFCSHTASQFGPDTSLVQKLHVAWGHHYTTQVLKSSESWQNHTVITGPGFTHWFLPAFSNLTRKRSFSEEVPRPFSPAGPSCKSLPEWLAISLSQVHFSDVSVSQRSHLWRCSLRSVLGSPSQTRVPLPFLASATVTVLTGCLPPLLDWSSARQGPHLFQSPWRPSSLFRASMNGCWTRAPSRIEPVPGLLSRYWIGVHTLLKGTCGRSYFSVSLALTDDKHNSPMLYVYVCVCTPILCRTPKGGCCQRQWFWKWEGGKAISRALLQRNVS